MLFTIKTYSSSKDDSNFTMRSRYFALLQLEVCNA
ncbi:hypothetical protein SAMN06295970_10669 [Noviherbaspirillum suwonense]|uniref:Transposase n=1 Tax=Noviherbaspirillum suwonense TaxID=1224511 RepID=A0ABY1Q675_9BURK|nr:hypothetical protein SAMN06295970_10669 [Noviherbaspirillum suwonense]